MFLELSIDVISVRIRPTLFLHFILNSYRLTQLPGSLLLYITIREHHILTNTKPDGAWPPSSIDTQTSTYIYDSSPPTAPQSSLFTFLLYLNDEFSGGETTFFLPDRAEGVINAFPVRPVQGSVALFPHGDSKGSLLHEGTGVKGEGNAKYIIRTDVEYDVNISS